MFLRLGKADPVPTVYTAPDTGANDPSTPMLKTVIVRSKGCPRYKNRPSRVAASVISMGELPTMKGEPVMCVRNPVVALMEKTLMLGLLIPGKVGLPPELAT